ncbi:MAG: hypothetical protein L3J10_04365 [Sulfurimonas sp.]|nr:hypothetical protein [Sulfurimonas sp.]
MKIKNILLIAILSITTNASEIKNSTCMIEGVEAPLWVCKPIASKGYLSAVGHAKNNPIETMKYVMAKGRAKTNLRIKKAKYNNKHLIKISIGKSKFTGNWVAPSGNLYVHITAKVLVK